MGKGKLNVIFSISILYISLLIIRAYCFQHTRCRCLHTTHAYKPCTIIYNADNKYGKSRILNHVSINIHRVLYPSSKHSSIACYLANENIIQDDSCHNEDVRINSTSNVTGGIHESTIIIQCQLSATTNIPSIESNAYDNASSSAAAAMLLAATHEYHNNSSHDINNTNPDINNISRTNIVIPTIKELMALGFPILGIWLLQPILSLVDSSILGLSPSVTVSELASLGPGIGFIDSTLYMFQFLGIGKRVGG
jgi:hypothetical protein